MLLRVVYAVLHIYEHIVTMVSVHRNFFKKIEKNGKF